MEQFLDTYIERMRASYRGFPPDTAHDIASVFLAFKFGIYANAVQECTRAISLIPDSAPNAALKKALSIIRVNAQDRDNSQVTADLMVAFSPEERIFTPINLPQDKIEDPGTYELDNALILVYVVALITSADDEEALEEHRRLIIRLLADYKKALGLE
jgi:hypothetical protein